MRRWTTRCQPSRIGIWRRIRYRILMWISASIGECEKRRFRKSWGSNWVLGRPKVDLLPAGSARDHSERSKCTGQRCLEAQKPFHARLDAVEFPIRILSALARPADRP